jgi:hypothetical protein
MSHVTSVLLCFSVMEEYVERDDAPDLYPVVEVINAALAERKAPFLDLAEHAGGYKHMQACVFAAAFNHTPDDVILAAIRAAPWEYPEYVQVYINGEHDSRFIEYGVTLAATPGDEQG